MAAFGWSVPVLSPMDIAHQSWLRMGLTNAGGTASGFQFKVYYLVSPSCKS
jgi:hypothetical protein